MDDLAGDHDQVHRFEDQDGWPRNLYEYRPANASCRAAPPVLLVHGNGCRYRVFAPAEGPGLAPFLARQGLHVFALELRGRGASLPEGRAARMRALLRGWSVQEFMERDLPEAIQEIHRITGAKQIDCIGHSLGGMLLIESLRGVVDGRVRRVVTVGSGDAQAMLSRDKDRSAKGQVDVATVLLAMTLLVPYLPIHWAFSLAARRQGRIPDALLMGLLDQDNVDRSTLRDFLVHGTSGLSRRKVLSLAGLAMSLRGRPANRSRQTYGHPTLFISGAGDRVVPPARVGSAARRAGNPLNRERCFSRSAGDSFDYGHTDLLIGRNAAQEVFPEILGWLQTGTRSTVA